MISYYFGYMPISTVNGEINDETIKKIKELSSDDIESIKTISKVKSLETIVELTNGEDFIIPSEISESELDVLIKNGYKYNVLADGHNNCVVLLIPYGRYASKNFDIIDERFNLSITKNFCIVNCLEINCNKYVLLCMFNDKWAYSRIGKDKIISPLKLIMKL